MEIEEIKSRIVSSVREQLIDFLESECTNKLGTSLSEVVQIYRYGCIKYSFYGKDYNTITKLLFLFPSSDEIFSTTVDPKEVIVCSGGCNPTSTVAYYGHNPQERKKAARRSRIKSK
jgi:hypothetical protein